MNDKELADKVVALDFAKGPNNYNAYAWHADALDWMTPEEFVRCWRVAGALMEKWGNGLEYVLIVDKWEVSYVYEESSFKQNIIVLNESLPRAIIEACCEALQGESDE